jgi:hypothetical protein
MNGAGCDVTICAHLEIRENTENADSQPID